MALWACCLLAGCPDRNPANDSGPESDADADADADADSDTDTGSRPNEPPTAPEVIITPAEPTVADDLLCSVSVPSEDPEEYPVSYRFNWTVDGVPSVLTTATVAATSTYAEEVWTCLVTPSDGQDEGPAGEASVTILTGCTETDVHEPNGTEGTAADLGTIDDCDGSAGSTTGIINGPSDLDWFRYQAEDSALCNGKHQISIAGNVTVCAFFACNDSTNPYPVCNNDSLAGWSAEGLPGCCGTADFGVKTGCSDWSDDLTVWLLATSPTAVCENYTIGYHY
jgi:hypothetical protein